MITKEFPDIDFKSRAELYEALREHKTDLKASKRMATKFTDPVEIAPLAFTLPGKDKSLKEALGDPATLSEISAELAINTTKILDSHRDVHLDNLWNKSAKEQSGLYLLQEHQMKFDHVISDEVKASVKEMSWKDLGVNYPGNTQVLLFTTRMSKERNPFMFDQYAKGFVKNHSVGMRYVSLELAINSESKWDVEQKEVWDKYIDIIVNRSEAEEVGYFWAVHEAKIIEGSAVLRGSNTVTPVVSASAKEAAHSTSKTEPPAGTPTVASFYKNLL